MLSMAFSKTLRCPAIRYEGVTGMGLLAPRIGWAMLGGHLIWTTDNGGTWADITPPGLAATMLDSETVFSFLDTQRMWVVIVNRSRSEDWFSGIPLRIVMTQDGGRTWHSREFDEARFPDLKLRRLPFPFPLSFVDSSHGWFLWACPTSVQSSLGKLLRTDDGGHTWKDLPDPPSAGELRFHTPQDGWMVVGGGDGELFPFHPRWRENVASENNSSTRELAFSAAHLLARQDFKNKSEAVMAVTYEDDTAEEGREVNSTYVSQDGGNSLAGRRGL